MNCGGKQNKRPPLDNVNALLSFSYSLATGMCASALESVGLDPYVGFMHTDRPGRKSLALDLVEEFRALMYERFVLSLINKRLITANDFINREDGAVMLTENGRKNFIGSWQKRKYDEIKHPLRFYYLGNNHKTKVEHIGAKPVISVEDELIF